MKQKLKNGETKPALSIRLNPILMKKLNKYQSNKSKYIEWLIYLDFKKNNIIDENFML